MKKLLNTLFILAYLALLPVVINLRERPMASTGLSDESAPVKTHCVGYTIIEAGVGVDCHGDTVKLIKKYGYYELASRYDGTAAMKKEALN